jgi:hypothetical protein
MKGFKEGDVVTKKSGKPFKNGEKSQTILSFGVNPEDPNQRPAAVFSDESYCSLDLLVNSVEISKTQRGFGIGKFKDSYGNDCSIQKSSSASDDFIWIGIDNPKLTVFEDENMGKYISTSLPKNWMVDSRMHLSRNQVAQLLPALQRFVERGELD